MLKLLYSASEKREANPLSPWKVTPQNHSESILLKHDVWSSHLSTPQSSFAMKNLNSTCFVWAFLSLFQILCLHTVVSGFVGVLCV